MWLRGWGARGLVLPSVSLKATILPQPHRGSPAHLLHRPGLTEQGPLLDAWSRLSPRTERPWCRDSEKRLPAALNRFWKHYWTLNFDIL